VLKRKSSRIELFFTFFHFFLNLKIILRLDVYCLQHAVTRGLNDANNTNSRNNTSKRRQGD
jgi:hypothetical protein